MQSNSHCFNGVFIMYIFKRTFMTMFFKLYVPCFVFYILSFRTVFIKDECVSFCPFYIYFQIVIILIAVWQLDIIIKYFIHVYVWLVSLFLQSHFFSCTYILTFVIPFMTLFVFLKENCHGNISLFEFLYCNANNLQHMSKWEHIFVPMLRIF